MKLDSVDDIFELVVSTYVRVHRTQPTKKSKDILRKSVAKSFAVNSDPWFSVGVGSGCICFCAACNKVFMALIKEYSALPAHKGTPASVRKPFVFVGRNTTLAPDDEIKVSPHTNPHTNKETPDAH